MRTRINSPEVRRTLRDVRSVAGTGGAMLAAQVLLMVNGILVARVLGPSPKGVVTAVLAWSHLLGALCSAGLALAYLVRVPRDYDPSEQESRVLGTAVANAIAFSVVVGGAAAASLALLLPTLVGKLTSDAVMLSAVAAAMIPLAVLAHATSMIQLALGRRGRHRAVTLAGPLTITVLNLSLWATAGLTARSVVLATLAGGAVALVVAVKGLPLRRLELDLRLMGKDLVFGAKTQIGSLFRIAHFRLDYLVMPAFLAAAELGVYATANNILAPMSALFGAAAVLIVPRASEMAKRQGDGPAAVISQVRFVRKEAWRYTVLVAVAGLAIAGVAPVFVNVVLGQPFRGAVVMVWILAPGYVALGLSTIIASASAGLRRPWIGIVADLTAVVLTASLLPVLLTSHGAQGAAITSTVAYTGSAVVAVAALAATGRRARRGQGGNIDPQAMPGEAVLAT